MDEEMEDFIGECSTPTKIDLDYEFDAAHFFDFTRPESIFEAQEAERWFESASSYPPSPLIVRLNWSKCNPVIEVTSSPHSGAGENLEHMSNNSDVDIDAEVSLLEENARGQNYNHHVSQDTPKVKIQSDSKPFKPRSSTLLKPTASQLAKQKKTRDLHSSRLCGRLHKSSPRGDDRSLQNIPGFENLATKRQKLESGFLRKVAHLKHPTPLLHKPSKKGGNNDSNLQHSRPKVTIPKEPELETAQRAQRRSFRSKNKSNENAKPSAHTFKARPLNRKILEAPSLPPPKKSTPQPPEFQVFHLKTMERAMQHSSANLHNSQKPYYVVHRERVDLKRLNSEDALKQEKCEKIRNSKASATSKKIFPLKGDAGLYRHNGDQGTVPKEFTFPTNTSLAENPPIELFTKLSLESEYKNNATYQSKHHLSTKGSKENVPSHFQPKYL